MDIIGFVSTKRDRALLVGDYDSYRSSLSRQLLALRRRLGRTTPKNAKFSDKAPVTAEDVASNPESATLLLIQSERAWAHAMHIKASHAEDNASKGISGPTRRHIVSKLHKAASYAEQLVEILTDRATSKATDNDYLEAKAYALSLTGASEFEKQVTKRFEDAQQQKAAWRKCLVNFSEAHVIYSSLLFATQKEAYREVISGTLDPSIRYAAYQSKLPRTVSISTVAKRNFRQDQTDLLALIKALNPNALSEESAQKVSDIDDASTVPIPTAINWRQRNAPIADAAIGQAIAAAAMASSKLATLFASSDTSSPISKTNNPKTLAAAYDPVLTAAQDAVDAVRRSISDLSKEGVAESDSRMQDLRVSDLAVNYSLISWRIGRNRVLISGHAQDDGATFEPEPQRARKSKAKSKSKAKAREAKKDADAMDVDSPATATNIPKQKPESVPRRLARLTERCVLLDSTLQSIDSIKYLPGASRDTALIAELDAQRTYYRALKCITIGYSYKMVEKHVEALALFARADALLKGEASDADSASVTAEAISSAPSTTPGLLPTLNSSSADGTNNKRTPPSLLVSPASLAHLRDRLELTILRQRGLVGLHEYFASAPAPSPYDPPLIERLDEFPRSGEVDLTNLVEFPPKLRPVPIKPIFLDIAWNYIDYSNIPGVQRDEGAKGVVEKVVGSVAGVAEGVVGAAAGGTEEQQPKKKGWFGFGR